MYLSFWYIVFVCHQNDVCENSNGSVYVVGILVWTKADSVSSVNCFIVVCECSSVMLHSIKRSGQNYHKSRKI